jgi:hypothetical protein
VQIFDQNSDSRAMQTNFRGAGGVHPIKAM